jgi:hypothetical protein
MNCQCQQQASRSEHRATSARAGGGSGGRSEGGGEGLSEGNRYKSLQ